MKFMFRHPELLLFGAIFTIYAIVVTPDFTWINADVDSFGIYLASKDPLAATNRGFLLYTLLGNAALHIPLGTEAWRLAFFNSLIPSVATSILIFYVVRKQTVNRIAPFIASASFAGCVVIVSQASIIEVYSMATFFVVLAYTLSVYNRPRWAA
ncbi:hypothetical protein LCGC14_2611140, partial [marine sediment metagenome]